MTDWEGNWREYGEGFYRYRLYSTDRDRGGKCDVCGTHAYDYYTISIQQRTSHETVRGRPIESPWTYKGAPPRAFGHEACLMTYLRKGTSSKAAVEG